MAIKVIKHGTKVFRAVCPICGCEFEYEYEDLKTEYGFVKEVKCPDCGNTVYHQEYKPIQPIYPTYPSWPYPYITWTSTGAGTIDCETCPNKPDPSKPVVGDTPCTWCKKNTPYCGDVFPTGYTGGQSSGIYSADPEHYKKVTYTNSSYVSPTFASNYTTNTK